MNRLYDVIIIGGGPAGASAALYAARGGLGVLLVHSGASALHRASRIENYYGSGAVSGAELYDRGLSQAAAVGAEIISGEVTFCRSDGECFFVNIGGAENAARRLVIATGAARKSVAVSGLTELEGKGVSYCAVCDAFFYRRKRVGVIGAGEFAKHEYETLANVADTVYLFTDGAEPSFTAENTVKQRIARVLRNTQTDRLAGVELENGETVELDGLFVAVGVMGASEIAKSMGVLTDGSGNIKTDSRGMTNIEGLYAAGDCTSGIKQIARAVNDGMNVAFNIISDIKNK